MDMNKVWCFILMLDVEPQYSGARIEGDAVTLDFVKKMIEDFKNQKFLHKRYQRKKIHCISVS